MGDFLAYLVSQGGVTIILVLVIVGAFVTMYRSEEVEEEQHPKSRYYQWALDDDDD